MHSNIATDLFYSRPFPALIVSSSTHDLLRLPAYFFQRSCTHHFQERRHATNIHILPCHPGIFDDIYHLLKESMRGLDKEAEGGNLCADARMLNKWFTEGM